MRKFSVFPSREINSAFAALRAFYRTARATVDAMIDGAFVDPRSLEPDDMQRSRGGANVLAQRKVAAEEHPSRSDQAVAGAQDPTSPPADPNSLRDPVYTTKLAETALDLIKSHRLPADPPSFEVWYTYAGRFIPALNQSLNDVLKSEQTLTADDVEHLYEKYVSSFRLGEHVGAIGGKIEGHVGNVLSTISTALGSAHKYSENLSSLERRLARNADPATLRAVIDNLLRATTEIEAQNEHFEKQLEDSQTQIQLLRANLDAVYLESRSDSLTSLGNRKYFDQMFAAAVAHAKQSADPLSLLMCDIDHFKYFNDTYGHTIGDDILRLIATVIKNMVKDRDIAARYGGEEFAIVMPNARLRDAVALAEQIRTSVMGRDINIRSTGKSIGRVTISIGAAQLRETEAALDLIERADAYLYKAKRAGRNKVVATS
jgi:diguanylate cyclase